MKMFLPDDIQRLLVLGFIQQNEQRIKDEIKDKVAEKLYNSIQSKDGYKLLEFKVVNNELNADVLIENTGRQYTNINSMVNDVFWTGANNNRIPDMCLVNAKQLQNKIDRVVSSRIALLELLEMNAKGDKAKTKEFAQFISEMFHMRVRLLVSKEQKTKDNIQPDDVLCYYVDGKEITDEQELLKF